MNNPQSDLDSLLLDPQASTTSINKILGHKIIIRSMIIIGIISLVSSGLLYYSYTKNEANIEIIETNNLEQTIEKDNIMDISGAVNNPGVYRLLSEARVNDAISLAGGLHENADKEWVQKYLNLAASVQDGQKLYIPFEGEEVTEENAILGIETDSASVNINTATAAQLEKLPKIGPTTAQKIIEYREKHGKFSNTEQLLEVPGIGEGIYAQIQDQITVH